MPNFHKVRVLVAESPAQSQSAIWEAISKLGCEIKNVNKPEEIVLSLKHGAISYTPFHLLVIDEELLGGDSRRVLQIIRQDPSLQNIKVLLLSSTPQSMDVASETNITVNACILKPVSASDIRAALQKALGFTPTSAGPTTPNRRILVVEDDELSQELMKILLTKHGYVVTLALNGLEALKIFKTGLFDLVLMDLQMPEMDGATTARRIREMEAGQSRIPIVALTASNIPTVASYKLSGEIDTILTKPFQIQNVLQVIESHIGNSTGQTTSPSVGTTTEPAVMLDIQNALPHFGLDAEQYREIFGEFQRSLSSRMAEMDEVFNTKDFTRLARLAHNLKGVAANVGAMQLSEFSAQLDEQCHDKQMSQIAQTLETMHILVEWLQTNAFHLIENYILSTPYQTRAE